MVEEKTSVDIKALKISLGERGEVVSAVDGFWGGVVLLSTFNEAANEPSMI